MSRDEIIEQATKVMHAEVCFPCDPQGCDWTHTREEARYARALADAGLLAQPLPTREEIANALRGDNCPDDPDPDEYCSCDGSDFYRMADIVLDLLKGQDR